MADILLFSTADWNHPVWTNKQHVACALAELGHRVLYVESVGLRPIRKNGSDARRLLSRLRLGLSAPSQVRRGIWCWSPLVLPGARTIFLMTINRLLFEIGLRFALILTGLRPQILWTYNPMTLAYYRPSRRTRLLYHCVDDIQAQPDMNATLLNEWESRLCRVADVVYTTSPALKASRGKLNPHTYYLPNVADNNHFRAALDSSLPAASDLAGIPQPRIGFVGSISEYKLDFPLITELARAKPEWSWVFVGPLGEGEGKTDLAMLKSLRNIYLLGPRSYRELPDYMKGFDVGLLPLRKNDYTHAMFPMKFFEYLASGLPVVSTDIDALEQFSSLARLVPPTTSAFLAAIAEALAVESKESAARRQRSDSVSAYNYAARTEMMMAQLMRLSTQPAAQA